MILVFRRRSVMGRARGWTFGALPGLGRTLANHIQNTYVRAKDSDPRNYQNREDGSVHRFATGKSKDSEIAKASIRCCLARTAIQARKYKTSRTMSFSSAG